MKEIFFIDFEMKNPDKLTAKIASCTYECLTGIESVMGFRGFARVRANPFLECRDNQRTRSCFLL